MSMMQRPILIATLTVFLLVATLGGALGVAMAKRDNVQVTGGFNTVGGPREFITPDKFLECVDEDDWIALYQWNAPSQSWERYINPAHLGDASYVNEGDYAIHLLLVGSGLHLLMRSDLPLHTITLLDTLSDTC